MKPWTKLEEATTPDGSRMSLSRRDGEYTLLVNGSMLMSSRRHVSEDRLAVLACSPFRAKPCTRVLIGGLGLGFTLRTALAHLPSDAEVVVAELMPQVVAWNRNPAYDLAADALADPRTRIEIGCVADLIVRSPGGFDAIMLDADNGTTAMCTSGNASLYLATGLSQVRTALRKGGNAIYWSVQADPRFAKLMTRAGFKVETERSIGTTRGDTLFIGRLPQPRPKEG